MTYYALTSLGKEVAKSPSGGFNPRWATLYHLRRVHVASDTELMGMGVTRGDLIALASKRGGKMIKVVDDPDGD